MKVSERRSIGAGDVYINKDNRRGYGGALTLIEFRLVGPEKLRIYHKYKIKLRTIIVGTANCLADAFLHHDASGAHRLIESCKASASLECIYFTPKSSLECNPIAESNNSSTAATASRGHRGRRARSHRVCEPCCEKHLDQCSIDRLCTSNKSAT